MSATESQRMPNHADLWDAYVAGVADGQKNRAATKEEIDKAADAYVKLWQERNEPVEYVYGPPEWRPQEGRTVPAWVLRKGRVRP